jgi:hypothetical protein
MLICRCAWHPRYYGYPLWNGISSWRGVAVQFTDGICSRCVHRFRDEHRRFLERRDPTTETPHEASTASAA